jgi:uncharacterized protein (TIGR02145 family)
MKKKLLLFTIIIFLFSCKKTSHDRIEICHYDQKTGTSHSISIDENTWPVHEKHGDVPGNCAVQTVTICDQTWMLKNLDVDHYRNGDSIPQVTDAAVWAALTTGAWCYYLNDPAYGPVYGKLYNWYAVNDPRGLAPTGWHVPTNDEWVSLINCLGGEYVAGGKLKETGTTHWDDPNVGATNETGFTALPGNLRQKSGAFSPLFATPFLGIVGSFWTSTEFISDLDMFDNNAHNHFIPSFEASVQSPVEDKAYGFSVRCVKNLPE